MVSAKPKVRRPVRAGISDGTEMRVIQVNDDPQTAQRCVGTIAMVTRDYVDAPTAISWMMMDLGFLGPGEYVQRYIVQGNVLVFQRNECINKMDGDWVLFVDSDMTWQPTALRTLVETQRKFDLDMVSGLCFQRGEPYQPTLYVNAGEHGYTFMERWPEDTAVEVDATGMAFILIHRRVFERILTREIQEAITDLEGSIHPEDQETLLGLRERLEHPFPSLDIRQHWIPAPFFKWGGEYGEDMAFCREAKAAGCQIFVDTSVKIGHVGQQIVNEETFLREIAFRDPKAQEFREAQLTSVGHRALTPEEARAKLGVTW